MEGQAQSFNRKLVSKVYEKGDYVLLYDHVSSNLKLGHQYKGPYVVVDWHGDYNVSITDGYKVQRVNITHLKAYKKQYGDWHPPMSVGRLG